MSPMEHSEANFITQKALQIAAAAVWILFRAGPDSLLLLLPSTVACREKVSCNVILRPTS